MWNDIRAAFSFLTIIPLGFAEGRKPGWSLAWYPLVGLAIGILLMAIAALSPFDTSLTAFFVLLGWVVITGGLHLDGFADSCDGLLATVSVERRLQIMKDPRTGAWAVIGLVMLLLGKWLCLQSLPPEYLLLAPVVGRWMMMLAVLYFPYARESGLGNYFRDGAGWQQLVIATGTMLVIAYRVGAIGIVIGVAVIAWGAAHWAAKRLGGGLTGDSYGALCEVTEWLCMVGVIVWTSA